MNPKLTEPPFVQAEGIINLRDAGGQPSNLPSRANHIVKLRYLYRAGEPSRITPKGVTQLRDDLGVRMVFDLRSDVEVKGYKADPLIIEGVGSVKAPVSSAEGYDPVSLARRVKGFKDDPLGVQIFYTSSCKVFLTRVAGRLSSTSTWKSWRRGRTLSVKS